MLLVTGYVFAKGLSMASAIVAAMESLAQMGAWVRLLGVIQMLGRGIAATSSTPPSTARRGRWLRPSPPWASPPCRTIIPARPELAAACRARAGPTP